jgi:hypothetical protein
MNSRWLCCGYVLVLVLLAGNAHAIPAFTRANKVECSTCHTIFPELNEYGEAFLKNGYVYVGKGKKNTAEKSDGAADSAVTAKPAPVRNGGSVVKGGGDADVLNRLKAGMLVSADAPASVKPVLPKEEGENSHPAVAGVAKAEGIALSGIPEQLPISFTANLHATYNPDAINEFDFSTRTLKLNAGGNFKEKAAFFATYVLYTEAPVSSDAHTSTTPVNLQGKNDIGELFFIWRNTMETPLNIKVGRLQPKLGLWKSSNKLSATNPYATYSYTVGPESLFNLEQPQDAIEANLILGNRLFVAGGIVSRKNQNTKEWYAHSSVKFGGADFLGNEPEIDLNKEESLLDYASLTIGAYGYKGTNGDPNTVTGVKPRQNNYYRVGVDADLIYKSLRCKLSGVMGNDDNPDLTYTLPEEKSYVAAIEGQYTIVQNLIGALRFEYQDDGVSIIRRYIPTFVYAPMENVKFVAEYKNEYGTLYKSTGKVYIENQISTLGVTFSF